MPIMRGSRNFRQGRSGSVWQKSSDVFFFFFLVLSLFYRSQMVNFKEIYHFSRFQRGSKIFQGGGPTFSRGGGVQLLIPYRNPYNLWFSRGGGSGPPAPPPSPLDPHLPIHIRSYIETCQPCCVVRIWSRNQNEFINASSNGSDEPAQTHGLARAFSVRTHSFHARMNQT